jgi:hypothetical protein
MLLAFLHMVDGAWMDIMPFCTWWMDRYMYYSHTELHGAPWCSPGASWCSLMLPGDPWYSLVLPGTPWYSMVDGWTLCLYAYDGWMDMCITHTQSSMVPPDAPYGGRINICITHAQSSMVLSGVPLVLPGAPRRLCFFVPC